MTINKSNYFKLLGTSRCVKGINRSIIIDTQNFNYYIIPLDLIKVIEQFNGERIECVFSFFEKEDREVIQEYFIFLIENELIVQFENKNILTGFVTSEDSWFDFSKIQNSVIDLSENNQFDLKDLLMQLSSLNCKYIQIRSFYRNMSHDAFFELLDVISSCEFLFVQLLLDYSKLTEKLNYLEIFSRNPSVREVTFYNSPERQHKLILESFVVNYITEDFTSEKCCGLISPSFFAINQAHFSESLSHNTCLNRKLSVDRLGEIKNCPSMAKSYGNIKDTKLIDVVNNPEFQKVWHIKKDEITKCKDCEFRHICTDCRAYLENPEDQYSAPLKCGYNPYTCEWEEWSTNPLKEKSIEFYGMQSLVKK
ncbi:MAG: grasp-with-spasm system SPASM domain peptide maturase [Chitinophagaceae bacterium]|nr:grasp-with-spasm system SPASM domain peptide maturase [Chitinophagaceae bacterium]